jgi:hypothetical protein
MIGLGIFCVIRNSRRHGSEQLGSVLGDYNEKPSRLDKVLPAFYIRRRDAELEAKALRDWNNPNTKFNKWTPGAPTTFPGRHNMRPSRQISRQPSQLGCDPRLDASRFASHGNGSHVSVNDHEDYSRRVLKVCLSTQNLCFLANTSQGYEP